MKVTILGCGGSGGVPMIGCKCPVCTSPDPKNRRSRVSIVVEGGPTRILVDAAPDLRQQFLANDLAQVDGVVLTHAHADHMHGMDDLRSVNFHRNAPLEVWGDAHTLSEATRRFGYAFNPPRHVDGVWYAPSLRAREITGPFRIGDIDVVPFKQLHGGDRDPTLGLRFGKFAYSTDVKHMPEEAFSVLEGVQVWVVDCLQEKPNFAHSDMAQTLGWIERLKPKRAILTHMNHTVDYATWKAKLPKGVEPAYDGMVLEI